MSGLGDKTEPEPQITLPLPSRIEARKNFSIISMEDIPFMVDSDVQPISMGHYPWDCSFLLFFSLTFSAFVSSLSLHLSHDPSLLPIFSILLLSSLSPCTMYCKSLNWKLSIFFSWCFKVVFNQYQHQSKHICADASVGIAYASLRAGIPLQSKSYDLMLMPWVTTLQQV